MVKNLLASAEVGLIPGLGRSPGEGNGNPLQYSCLKNPMDRGAWWATAHGVKKDLDMTRLLNNNKLKVYIKRKPLEMCRREVVVGQIPF